MKHFRAEMGGIEPWLWFNRGRLEDRQRSWTQQPEHWTLFFLEHSGGFSVGNDTFAFHDGDVALVAPGARVGFVRTGDDTPHYALTFMLRPRVEVVALPAVADLGEKRELRRGEVRDAEAQLTFSIGRGLAFVYNLLWDIALPPDVLGRSTTVQEFERLVTERLAEKLSVTDLAAELGISASQLLRVVRAECGMTVQEFIREQRTATARSLIAASDLPLKAIAAKTGMRDLQYFNKAIRAASGLSPRGLRDLAVNRTRHG
jgi:AraC-like DNA-binding protein